MPFKSMAQMKWMFKNKPEIARQWADKYGVPNNLPFHNAAKKSIKTKKKGGK
jgi:hypothetical protein